jgi:hypothetical protein
MGDDDVVFLRQLGDRRCCDIHVSTLNLRLEGFPSS